MTLWRKLAAAVLLIGALLLIPSTSDAEVTCFERSDGCNVCIFYDHEGYHGQVSWCH